MLITLLKSKIHCARLTQTELRYEGSITIDEDLMDAAQLLEHEKVHVMNINNGSRIETYIIKGKRGSGVICLNGAAARHGEVGDEVIILSYVSLEPDEVKKHKPTVILVNEKNKVSKKLL